MTDKERLILGKREKLEGIIREMGSLAIGFSGGVDSTFLLKTAGDILGDRAVALTARSAIFPVRESREAADFCRREGIRQIFVDVDELEEENFRKNPTDRCYHCKKRLFSGFRETAEAEGISWLAEGSNMDDLGDYRPGLRAVEELGVRSPLREAGLYKSEIRLLSRELGLETWQKSSFACLASRFPYGQEITREDLARLEAAEQYLLDLGFGQERVRLHGNLVRIELVPEDLERALGMREQIVRYMKERGFSYVTLDLQGFRSGSMNETL